MNTSPPLRLPRRTNPLRLRHRLLLALLLAGVLAGQALAGETTFRHGYMMRGQVLEAAPGSVVVCIGERDGAEVGQVLSVVRHVPTAARNKGATHRYRQQDTGTVRITSLFDEHYATAEIVKGSPKVHDVVELKR